MRRRSLTTGDVESKLGSHRQSHTLSIRVSPTLAALLEEERKRVSKEIEVEISASELARHAIEKHLAASGHAVGLTPWPEKLDPSARIRRLEEEIRRLRNARPVPGAPELKEPYFE